MTATVMCFRFADDGGEEQMKRRRLLFVVYCCGRRAGNDEMDMQSKTRKVGAFI